MLLVGTGHPRGWFGGNRTRDDGPPPGLREALVSLVASAAFLLRGASALCVFGCVYGGQFSLVLHLRPEGIGVKRRLGMTSGIGVLPSLFVACQSRNSKARNSCAMVGTKRLSER